ncbi:MAG: hypothetical protein ACI9CO_002355 [Candidatus Azotimanducaceae bacterium]|jgi:hypothetical protein
MYVNGLGFHVLDSFEDHNGFDGSIIGHELHSYHFEFTHHRGTTVGRSPTKDNLLVFYFSDITSWESCCKQMLKAGFNAVESYNEYWDVDGKTFEDIDGYRVVLQSGDWLA